MAAVTEEQIFEAILGILTKLAEDWEYDGEITLKTLLVADLGLESIDVVVLGTTIQNHFNQPVPFAEFLAEVGAREVRDIRIDELVEFIHRHMNSL